MTAVPGLTFERQDAVAARARIRLVQEIFEQSYTEQIASGDAFASVDAFMHRFDAYSSNPRLDLVFAYIGDEAVGQTWGWPYLSSSSWDGVVTELDPDYTREDGTRTFALSEIMVKQPYTGRGIARALHDELLAGRQEERAVLLVRPDNQVAYKRYLSWGWEPVAQKRPSWPDAPTFDVLVRDLTT